tara:strand:+ start:2247 stop:2639 length:393 start_codon:yes stop_codon:yes gene_type:complete
MDEFNPPAFQKLEKILGTKFKITESSKSSSKREQEEFCSILKTWDKAWIRGNKLFEESGIDMGGYDSYFYNMIESLFIISYGVVKTEIIAWWVYERYLENGELAILVTEDNKEHLLKTPLQLYKFIKKRK